MDGILDNLNEPQMEAVTCVEGPLLVLAGAGSGKTRVITRRVAYMISQGISPYSILAITFTNKAAQEMRNRVGALRVPAGATVCTFHSLCARLLREFAEYVSVEPNYSIYDRNDQVRLVKEAMKRANLSAERLSPARVHSSISNAKNELQTAQDYEQNAGDFYSCNVAKVFCEYQKLLKENNALDFDDLLIKVAYMMRDHPDVRQLLAQRYSYLLIDEYQDTNRAQFIIANGIAMDHKNICATGDPDQSIYGWRGADINNILDFESHYPGAKVVRMEENYRSTKPILISASRLITFNTRRKEKALWTNRTGGSDVMVVYCDNEKAEVRYIIDRINEFRAQGMPFEDMAIFYRINSLSRNIEEGLLRAGVPYRVARGIEFYNRKEIKDVLAYLRVIVNPRDDLSCERIINTPTRGIGATTVNKLKNYGFLRELSLLEACGEPEGAGLGAVTWVKVRQFAQMIAQMAEHVEKAKVGEIVSNVVKLSGLEEFYCGDEGEDSSAMGNINELITTAVEFDAQNRGGTLVDYLQQVSLVADNDHFEGADGAVSLMTLHAAKGLEFPVVFIVGCEDGILPIQRMDDFTLDRLAASHKLEEERRLAFVGMTRAKEHLFLTSVRMRMVRGKTTPQAASGFLAEIGAEMVTVEDLTTHISLDNRKARGGFYEDYEQRAMIESMDAAGFPPEYEHLKPGTVVSSPKFGIGKVTKLGTQPWPETFVEVLFKDIGSKKLKLSLANLEIMEMF